jgi:glycosyltransferase involved in cell wall biosynthesis
MGNARILILTYRYAPALHPRAFRWSAIAEHWAGKGHRVDVVTIRTPGLPREEKRNGVSLHRVGGAVIENLKARVRRPAGDRAEPRGGVERGNTWGGAGSGWSNLAEWASDRVWKRVRWPDYAATWYFPAVKEGRRLLREGGFDGLVTVSDPFTAHLAGLSLKRDFPGVSWAVDIGDPFSFQEVTPVNNPYLYRRLNFRTEGKVFALAEAVAVTNQRMLREYAERFPGCADRIRVIPPLLSLEGTDAAREQAFPGDSRIRLVFVGTLYLAVRSPEFLLGLYERLRRTRLGDRLELHIFGNLNDCEPCFQPFESLRGRAIFLHGIVDRPKVLRAMMDASALVHIGNATTYQLPSKVVEYASTGKPILNLVTTLEDSASSFLGDYPALLEVPASGGFPADSKVEEVVRFLEHPPPVDARFLAEWLAGFRVETLASAYENLLEVPGKGLQ